MFNKPLAFVVVVQSLGRVQLFVTPWTAACQAFLSITNSLSLLKFMSMSRSICPKSRKLKSLKIISNSGTKIRHCRKESITTSVEKNILHHPQDLKACHHYYP